MKRIIILLLLLSSSAFAYTTGNGSIQSCYFNDYDYCNVTVSSTVNSDINITNFQTVISPDVTITILGGRLSINSSEYIWVQGKIIGDGARWPGHESGGSGGGEANDFEGGAGGTEASGGTNGADGSASTTSPCTAYAQLGSGLTPFEYAAGSAGTGDGDNEEATGGGFYAGGGAFGNSISGCAGGSAGGSGHALRLISAVIQNDGNISLDGADAYADHAKGGGGGGGAGEFISYFAYLNNTGTITARGGNGLVFCGAANCFANGGAGGRMKFCAKIENTTGATSVVGGTCDDSGTDSCSNGASGTITYSTSTCFEDVLINMYQNNLSFSSMPQNISFNIGVFNDNNVSCNYSLDGTNYSIGDYNLSTSVSTHNVTINVSGGSHTMYIYCSGTGITSRSSDNITFTMTGDGGDGDTGGGGGGGAPAGTTSSEYVGDQSPPGGEQESEGEQQEEQFYPDPNSDPDYYTNPPDDRGENGIFNLADKIADASNGAIKELPHECKPTIQNTLNFVGADFADKFLCEGTSLLSLYISISPVLNATLGLLIALAILMDSENKKNQTRTIKSNLENILVILMIIVFVWGFDFLAFALTAMIIYAGGSELT